MFKTKAVFALLAIVLLLGSTACKEETVQERIEKLPGVKLSKLEAKEPFKEFYEIMLTQPLDHKNPSAGTFQQRVTVGHVDYSKPVVIITEGYAMGKNYIRELAEILKCNQIRVEHRYFGKSMPEKKEWKYLNTAQATADYHNIKNLFRSMYPGKWISTGWSKGGQTSMVYRKNYPEDVALTVAYDAPLNFELEDKRIDAFFDTVGDQETRDELKAFQKRVLEKKDEMVKLFKAEAEKRKLTYSIGYEKGLEYTVLEYPFSFWQYFYMTIKDIPGKDAAPEVMFKHLAKVSSVSAWSDRAKDSVAMYQFSTEFGYYGHVKEHLKDMLSSDSYTNHAYAPEVEGRKFDPALMIALDKWMKNSGENILCIYGGQDPWSGTRVDFKDNPKLLRIVKEGGNHFTFINNFEGEKREMIMKYINTALSTGGSK